MGVQTVAVVAHNGAGKTSLTEGLLHLGGAVKKRGLVDNGGTVTDFLPEEKERKTSLQSAIAHLVHKDSTVDLIDTPGSMNFLGSILAAVRVADGVLMLSSADPGLQSETEFLWEYVETEGLARLMVINQMDREQADFAGRLNILNNQYGNRFVPVTIPLGSADGFVGVVNLITMHAYDYSNPDKPVQVELPDELAETAAEMRYRLVESSAEADDELLEKYLETESLDNDEILRGLKAGTRGGNFVPVFAASTLKYIGLDQVFQGVLDLLPQADERRLRKKELQPLAEGYVSDGVDNEHFGALVFKSQIDHYAGKLSVIKVFSGEIHAAEEILNTSTDNTERPAHLFKLMGKEQVEVKQLRAGEVGALPKLGDTHMGNTLCSPKNKIEFQPIGLPNPVLTYAMEMTGKGEEEKLSTALQRMMEEDPTLSFRHDSETGDFLVSGMGRIHLELVLEKLKREYSIQASFVPPKVPYRETIRSSSKAQGKYKKQTGGRGQYGDCWLELKPKPKQDQLSFNNAIVGGAIPRTYIPAVEKGVSEAMQKGVVASFPVIGIDATVYDGSYHDVDSSEMAFKIAGSMAFKKAMEDARPVLLEPIIKLEIVVNADYMGDVMGDINARRGKVLGMDTQGRNQVVRAEVPMSEVLTYAIDLRAMTSGLGYFTQEFSHYEEVPPNLAGKIIQQQQEAS